MFAQILLAVLFVFYCFLPSVFAVLRPFTPLYAATVLELLLPPWIYTPISSKAPYVFCYETSRYLSVVDNEVCFSTYYTTLLPCFSSICRANKRRVSCIENSHFSNSGYLFLIYSTRAYIALLLENLNICMSSSFS